MLNNLMISCRSKKSALRAWQGGRSAAINQGIFDASSRWRPDQVAGQLDPHPMRRITAVRLLLAVGVQLRGFGACRGEGVGPS
mgnify:CR=1 FL=1